MSSLEAYLREAAAIHGCELYALIESSKDHYVVMIDHPEHPVTIEECLAVSAQIDHFTLKHFPSRHLEIEVCSPGADRPLLQPEHFRKSIDLWIDLQLKELLLGKKSHTGRLLDCDDNHFSIALKDDSVHKVRYTDLKWARWSLANLRIKGDHAQ